LLQQSSPQIAEGPQAEMRSLSTRRRPLVYAGVISVAALALLVCVSMQKAENKRFTALEEDEGDDADDDDVEEVSDALEDLLMLAFTRLCCHAPQI
jgi:hypothetical protein